MPGAPSHWQPPPGRAAAARAPGPRDSRLEQPVVVHPGNMPKIWAGLETRHSIRGGTIPLKTDIDAGQPARDIVEET